MDFLSVRVKSAESQVLPQTNRIRINEDDPRNLYFQRVSQALDKHYLRSWSSGT